MGALEIVLVLAGAVICIISFLVPSGSGQVDEQTKELAETEVKNLVNKEVAVAKGKIDDIVDETVNYAMEKTERALERLSNEKIMAVNEYSDTVLEDINKNHKEVLFLYDMLNDKHQNIQTTVSQVEKTVKEVEQKATAVAQAEPKEQVKTEMPDEKAERMAVDFGQPSNGHTNVERESAEDVQESFSLLMPQKTSAKKVIRSKAPAKTASAETPELDISFMKDSRKNGNNNERILELHNQGKSNVAIAKELGLGVGEVKLVIDLFESL